MPLVIKSPLGGPGWASGAAATGQRLRSPSAASTGSGVTSRCPQRRHALSSWRRPWLPSGTRIRIAGLPPLFHTAPEDPPPLARRGSGPSLDGAVGRAGGPPSGGTATAGAGRGPGDQAGGVPALGSSCLCQRGIGRVQPLCQIQLATRFCK